MTANTVYAKAGMLLFPTRVVLDNNERSTKLTIKNTGETRGLYRIELVEIEIKREGGSRVLEEDEDAMYSAKKISRISPRRVLVEANSTQSVRIAVRKPKNLEDGEYRSHIKVTMLEDNVDENGRPIAVVQNDDDNFGIQIKARLVNIIPLIIRHGETQHAVTIGEPSLKIAQSEDERTALIIPIQRTGNRSSLGDIKVEHIDDGKNTVLKMQSGVAVYRPLEERLFELPLDVPDNISLTKGVIKVTYTSSDSDDEEGSEFVTESSLVL
ncbi:MAG: hypothetical protein MK137_04310 [Rickettsiales bacterium]|nr:hypothetical protein [Rickettsiales bacterium]